MMRLISSFAITTLFISCCFAQQQAPLRGSEVPDYARQPAGQQAVPRNQTDPRALQMQQGQQQQPQQQQMLEQAAGNPNAANAAAAANQRPFPPLDAVANGRLQKLLTAWESQSQSTKTLSCKFQKWHFDLLAAPAGVHATKSSGDIRYKAPDNGMFREDELLFYKGMEDGEPTYGAQPGKVGDYWVCTGEEVIEFNGTDKKCTIIELPEGMRGQEIFNSPLPFVFNLDAKKIQERYWVREIKAPKEGIYLIEAWPKRQVDRGQYKLVQIALDTTTFLPQALIMYAPNFNAKTAPMWDHYEFTSLGRNKLIAGIQDFMKNFIPKRPPTDWQVVREKMADDGALPPSGQQQATGPAGQPIR